jgi:phospholipase C
MTVRRTLQLALVLLACGVASPAGARAELEGIHKIQHVIVIMQENRTFDTYFGTYPGANGIPHGVCVPDPEHGGCVRPFFDPEGRNAGGPHGTGSSIEDIDEGKMDGFVRLAESALGCTETGGCGKFKGIPLAGIDVMGYHDARQIPNYWKYAEEFVLQDAMFEPVASWSLPEHLEFVSGWTAICPKEDNNPLDCVNTLKPVQPAIGWATPIVQPPRATYAWTDITYLLARAGVSWRYYMHEGAEPDCEDDEAVSCEHVIQNAKTPGIWNPLPDFVDVRQDRQLGNIQPLPKLYKALATEPACGLPNVSWIVPSQRVSEHPPSRISKGQAYVTTLVNSIMRSPCWKSTAIFVSWDDWGGFYDHVVPPSVDENGYGIRVPGLVISPYAKRGYIDHQQLSHDAYLKFIEDDFLAGQRLDPRTDGRPDPRPDVRERLLGTANLADDFNFSQTPRPPLLLAPKPVPGPASKEP